jgi:hypothetical protein
MVLLHAPSNQSFAVDKLLEEGLGSRPLIDTTYQLVECKSLDTDKSYLQAGVYKALEGALNSQPRIDIYWKWITYHGYQPSILTPFNNAPIINSERKRDQLQHEKAAVYNICKARGDKWPYLAISPLVILLERLDSSLFSSLTVSKDITNAGSMMGQRNPNPSAQPPANKKTTSLVTSGKSVVDGSLKVNVEVARREEDILSGIIHLEEELGRQPNLLDLLCRFSRQELDIVWDSLLWLYPDLDMKEPSKDHREIMVIA